MNLYSVGNLTALKRAAVGGFSMRNRLFVPRGSAMTHLVLSSVTASLPILQHRTYPSG